MYYFYSICSLLIKVVNYTNEYKLNLKQYNSPTLNKADYIFDNVN